MKQIVFLTIVAGFVSCMGAHAQKIVYAYDASGNCTGRTLVTSGLKSAMADTNTDTAQKNADNVQNEPDLKTLDENSIKVYPNPTGGQFHVELTGYGEDLAKGMMTIYSEQGRVVLKLNSLQPVNAINLNSQTNGTYVLQINIGEKSLTHKIVITK